MYEHERGCHMSVPTRPFPSRPESTPPAIHPLAPEVTPLLTPPTVLQKKRACHREEECTRPPQRTSPHRSLPPQTSTHQTHQVISWGLKYLLGKYLAWLSDPTSQFKDTGLTNFSLYPANHQDIRRPRPTHTLGL